MDLSFIFFDYYTGPKKGLLHIGPAAEWQARFYLVFTIQLSMILSVINWSIRYYSPVLQVPIAHLYEDRYGRIFSDLAFYL